MALAMTKSFSHQSRTTHYNAGKQSFAWLEPLRQVRGLTPPHSEEGRVGLLSKQWDCHLSIEVAKLSYVSNLLAGSWPGCRSTRQNRKRSQVRL